MIHIVTQNLALIEIAKGLGNDFGPMHKLMLQWINIVDSIPYLSAQSIKNQIDLCENIFNNSKGAFLPKDETIANLGKSRLQQIGAEIEREKAPKPTNKKFNSKGD